MLMKIMGGKKPDALFPLLGDSDSPLPLPTLYLKKIMTEGKPYTRKNILDRFKGSEKTRNYQAV